MARKFLMLSGVLIQNIDDFKKGVESVDAIDAFRSGAIARWLKEKEHEDILSVIQSAGTDNLSDGQVARLLLGAVGTPPEEIQRITNRILRKRRAMNSQKDDGNMPSAPVNVPANVKPNRKTKRLKKTSEQYSLESSFALAVQNGDIEKLCREHFKGGIQKTKGGKVNWTNLASVEGWRLQQNDNIIVRQFVSDHCRVLAPDDIRHGYARREIMEEVFKQYWEEHT